MKAEKVRLRKQIIEHMNFYQKNSIQLYQNRLHFRCMRKKRVEAKTIGITLSMENEVNTYPIIEKLGKKERKL